LWHWPLYVFATMLVFNKLEYAPIVLCLTFFFSYLSYTFIESNKRIIYPKKIILSAIVIIAVSFLFYLFPINQYFLDKKIIELSDYQENHKEEINEQMSRSSCFITSTLFYEDFSEAECLKLSDSKANILLIGDSHAAVFSLSLKEKLASQDKNFLQATTSSCPFFLNPTGRDENVKLVRYILYEFIPQNCHKIERVIISANWRAKTDEELKTKVPELIDYIQKFDIKVKVLGQTETYSMSYPSIAARQLLLNKNIDSRYIELEPSLKNDLMKSFIPEDIYVDIYEIKDLKKISGYTPYLYDEDHLTKFGTEQIINYAERKRLFD
jgi:hypothetical protein